MTTFLLIRHALTDLVSTGPVGWMAGIHLNAVGRAQAERLTAAALAARFAVEVQALEEVGELRYGDWTGRDFNGLAGDAAWHRFNALRSLARIPNGEMMIEAQARIIAALERLRLAHPEQTFAVVSHGDIIKAAVAHYLGVPLDLLQRIEISPASVSVVNVNALDVRVLAINWTDDPMALNG